MKIFAISCLISLFSIQLCTAQELDSYFMCHTKEYVVVMLDSLLSKGTRHYELKDIRKQNNDHTIIYSYKGFKQGDADSVKLVAVVNFFMQDANPALEIEGMPVYVVDDIYGVYLDLFPIYQLADTEATIEETSKYGADKRVTNSSRTVYYSLRQRSGKNEWHFRRF